MMLLEAMDECVAPDGADVLLELIGADIRALIDLERSRLQMMQVTAVFSRHLGDDLED